MKHLVMLGLLFISLITISCKSKTDETSSSSAATGKTPDGIAYTIDAPRSEVKWSAFKPTGTHHGIVPVEGGKIYVQGDIITGGVIEINMAGLQDQDLDGEMKEKLESHLKGTAPGKEEDFFNVGKYPTATYTILGSSKLENDPAGTHLIQGELRIKDITKPVNFKANVDLANPEAIRATADPFVIDRTEWGLKFKSRKFFDDLKDDFINDEIRLELVVGAIKGNG